MFQSLVLSAVLAMSSFYLHPLIVKVVLLLLAVLVLMGAAVSRPQ